MALLVRRRPRGRRAARTCSAGADLAAAVYGLINAIGYVFPLVIGSLAMTTEFRHQTITQSLLVEPRRGVFLGAKLLATVPLGLLYGVVGTSRSSA